METSKPVGWLRSALLPRENRECPWASCPNCGTVGLAKLRGRDSIDPISYSAWSVASWALRGERFRCERCRLQFFDRRPLVGETRPKTSKFAQCPRCANQNLESWNLEDHHPPLRLLLRLQLGATPYCCRYCHQHFASSRPLAPIPPSPVQEAQPLRARAAAAGGSYSMGAVAVETPVRQKARRPRVFRDDESTLL